MMQMNNNTPFYRTQWGMPQARHKAPSKVVSIPVRFVGSDPKRIMDRADSATKIQKVVRGFLVRKSLKRISAIRVEVEQIESKVSAPEMMELIKRENRERVRVSETIMNLLLKLDSVKVLHYPGLRDCRKALIKKAIALQEIVDQMVGPTEQDQSQASQAEDSSDGKKVEALGNEGAKESVGTNLVDEVEENCLAKEDDEEGEKMEDLRNEEKMEVEAKEKEDALRNEGGCVGEKSVGTSLVEEVEENCLVKEEEVQHEQGGKMEGLRNEEKMEVEEKEDDLRNEEGVCVGEESVGTSLVEEEIEENCVVKEEEGGVGCEGGRGEGGDRNRELLEKMMEDNEKMMGMMGQLFRRNEMQTRLLNSLSNRVEQLERAFACEKLRRKKRKSADVKHKETEPKPKNGYI